MPWLQLTLSAPKDQAPGIEEILEGLGALSVTYGDAGDQPLLEPMPGETRLWHDTRVTGLFEQDQNADLLRAALKNALPDELFGTLAEEVLEDQVWERAWLDDFHPMRFGHRLWVCPAGQHPEQNDAVILNLDPGLAFGTGTHPSTALCLEWLDGADLTGKTVLDFGCGSGILAIATILLGAEAAVAVDHDPQALEATLDNAAKNGVADRVTVLAPAQLQSGRYDLVLANILAGTLIDLSNHLKPFPSEEGELVMAGILSEQAEQVAAAYQPDFNTDVPLQKEDWVLLHARRGDN